MSSTATGSNVDWKRLCERFDVNKAWLFGSRAKGGHDPKSDWDIVVEFKSPPGFLQFMGLKQELEDSLGGRVDLISKSGCTERFWKAIEGDLVDVA